MHQKPTTNALIVDIRLPGVIWAAPGTSDPETCISFVYLANSSYGLRLEFNVKTGAVIENTIGRISYAYFQEGIPIHEKSNVYHIAYNTLRKFCADKRTEIEAVRAKMEESKVKVAIPSLEVSERLQKFLDSVTAYYADL